MIRRNLAWILFGLSFALNAFVIGGFFYAKHYGPPWGGERGGWIQRLDNDWPASLKLQDNQERAFRRAFREMRQRNAGRARELMQLRQQIVTELRKDRFDYAAIDPLIDRAAALRGDIQKDGIRTAEQMAETLRPEQRALFREAVIARTQAVLSPGGRPREPRMREERR
jgi:Spy/CpxP family protein refolding chaperone